MAWNNSKSAGTKHSATCNMAFGRKDPTCPRCQELIAGSKPRSWNQAQRQSDDTRRCIEIRNHKCSGTCFPVCTFGDW
jgi:hypothetical protein